MAFFPRYSAYPKAHGHYQAPSPGGQWHPQVWGVLSFPLRTLGTTVIPERLSHGWLPRGYHVPYPVSNNLSQWLGLLGSRGPDEHLPEIMERALSGTKLKPKVSKSNVKI